MSNPAPRRPAAVDTAEIDTAEVDTAEIAFAAAAGALPSYLRERSGSLAAPVLPHLAANCTTPLASALARTLDR